MIANDTVALAEARLRVARGDLAAIRQRARLSQRDIGRAVGVSRIAVSRWESGQRVPSGEPAVRLAALLRELEVVTKGSSKGGGGRKEVDQPAAAA